jgi:hypothetical protein
MSSTACSRLPLPEDFSITSIRRRSSSRSSIAIPPALRAWGLQKTTSE